MAECVLLGVSAVPVGPIRDGYSLRVAALLEELVRDFRVVLVAPAGERSQALAEVEQFPIPKRFDLTWNPPHSVREAVRHAALQAMARHRPDVALLWPGCEFLGISGQVPAPFVADRIDCQTLTLWRSLLAGSGMRHHLRALRDLLEVALYERRLVGRATATIAVGDDDARALRRLNKAGAVHVVPNGVRIDANMDQRGQSERPTLAFTGVLSFMPNVEAALHLGRDIWPQVRAEVPEAELVIAGHEPLPEVRALSELSGVTVLANQPDLRPVIQRAWLCVAPMRTGSGIKNKVLEAWACGRPVVLSPIAANGLALDGESRSLVAEDDATMVAKIVTLLRSPEELRRMGERCRCLAEAFHGWGSAGRRVAALLQAAAAEHRLRTSS